MRSSSKEGFCSVVFVRNRNFILQGRRYSDEVENIYNTV